MGASNMKGLVPLEWAGATGRFHVDEAEVGGLKDVADIGEERGPALGIAAAAAAAAARTASWGITSPATAKLTWASSWG